MKVLFMGTPAFAAESLRSLLDAGYIVTAVVTRPDAAAGRGLKVRPGAVKTLAEARGLAVWQPPHLKDPSLPDRVRAASPDVVVVAAYGRILPPALLEAAPAGAVNVHASLLPKYRGAAPVAWAIARGERQTGVTTMKMAARLDAGDILLQRAVAIGDEETAGELETRLARIGGDLLLETLAGIEAGRIAPIPQDETQATWAPALGKQDARIDWDLSAVEIARRVRAFDPHPVAHTRTADPGGVALRVWKARPSEGGSNAPPGTVLGVPRGAGVPGVPIACGGGTTLLLLEVQPEGRRRMTALEALSGRYLGEGDRLGGD